MPDFGIFRGFNEKLFGDKLYAGQLPTQLGMNKIDFFKFLLDNYGGAAAAYSLRLLSSTYTGDAIEVRRASDNTTQDIGFVNNELDVTTLESFCSGTDGFVTAWYDQSGNGYDATQGTLSNQPQIVSSGSVILESGKPCINMNSSKSTNRFLFTSQVSPSISQPLSYFITTKVDAITNNAIIDGFTNGNGLFFRSSSANLNYTFGNVLTDSSFPSTQQLITVLANTTTSSIYNNGNLQLSGNLGNNNFDGIYIGNLGSGLQGANYQLVGTFQELIIYSSNQSSNRTGIETNINNFYSIYP